MGGRRSSYFIYFSSYYLLKIESFLKKYLNYEVLPFHLKSSHYNNIYSAYNSRFLSPIKKKLSVLEAFEIFFRQGNLSTTASGPQLSRFCIYRCQIIFRVLVNRLGSCLSCMKSGRLNIISQITIRIN